LNQQFGLLATPATARRLVILAGVCKLDLSESIRALAQQQMVPETLFDPILCPATEARCLGTQFIADCGFRCVVVRRFLRAMDMTSILNATRLEPSKRVLILTNSRLTWKPVVKSLFMTDRVSYFAQPEPLLQAAATLRDGILLVDVNTHASNAGYQIANVLRLYPASLIYVRIDEGATPNDHPSWAQYWVPWADLLFPQMPPLANSLCPLQEGLFHNVLVPLNRL
jgi:hypothetical protein